jgi:outer membrane protein
MNVKEPRAGRLALMAGIFLALFAAEPAWAFDPLWTEPGVLDRGPILPGDKDPLPVSVTKNLAKPLSLADVVDLALADNPQLKAAWAEIKVQAGQVGEARAAYWPTLSGAVSGVDDRTQYVGTDFPPFVVDSYQANATASWRVLNFGEQWFNSAAAGRLLEAALASHNAALQKTLSEVIQAYFEAFTDREIYYADCRNAEYARDTLLSTKKREAKGVSTRSETLQATTALEKTLLDVNRAKGSYQKSLAVLTYSMGLPSDTALVLPDTLDDKPEAAEGDLKAWMEEAQKNHPAILAARAQFEAAHERVLAAVSDSLPTVDVSASFYHNGRPGLSLSPTDTDETLAVATLSIPLFNGFSSVYKVRGAEARAEEAQAQLEDTQHQTLMEVIKAYADTASARQNLQASDDLLQAASSSLEVSKRRYDKRAANLLEMLNAQSELANAQEEKIRCVAEWRSARLRLMASAGQLGRFAVSEKGKRK